MSKIEIEIPDGHRAEWVNGVLTLVDDKPIEYKFKVGDKVIMTAPNSYPQDAIYEIVELKERDGEPLYEMKCKDGTYKAYERYLKLAPQDITERIKSFTDAVEWCERNGKENLVLAYNEIYGAFNDMADMRDVFAYLKLRIITAALNEGWQPTFEDGERRWHVEYFVGDRTFHVNSCVPWEPVLGNLLFKSKELAKHALKQFYDVYLDCCGCYKENNN